MGSSIDKVALVTGSSRRIGRDVAIALAGEGCRVIVQHRASPEEAGKTVAACEESGGEAIAVGADLHDRDETLKLLDVAKREGASIFVHLASTFSRVPFFSESLQRHADVLDGELALHVVAPYLLTRGLAPKMVEDAWGRIVIFGDWSSDRAAFANYAPYLASKAAVPGLVEALALELGRASAGVTVNGILPGPILPPRDEPEPSPEWLRRQTFTGTWLGTETVVNTVLYLLHNGGVTGETIRIDGGQGIRAGAR